MADLIAPVKNGKLEEIDNAKDKNKEQSTVAGGNLGKEEFLKLLVAQMQYQDPLEPNKDSDYIAQLAQFSSLEQMQNLNTTMTNSTSMSYVGQEVIVHHTDSNGNTSEVQGVVEYVQIQSGKAYVSIDGKLYRAEEISTVIDSKYSLEQKKPSVEATALEFTHVDPQSQDIRVNLGEDDGKANAIAVVINGQVLESKYLSFNEEKGILTIAADAFRNLDAGKYEVTLAFDDALETTVSDKVVLTVRGIKPEDTKEEQSEETPVEA